MWTSLEILVPDLQCNALSDFADLDIVVLQSSPPKSHRGESSTWQKVFDDLGGCLFHLGDPVDIRVRQDRFYLYDSFDPEAAESVFVKFLHKYQRDFDCIVRALCERSHGGQIYITTDMWLGPEPKRYKFPVGVQKFLRLSQMKGIRQNSLREVVREAPKGCSL